MKALTLFITGFLLVAIVTIVLLLSDDARDVAGGALLRGGAFWLVILAVIALGVWAVRRLPPRRGRRSPPGMTWFPSGTWWGDRKRDE